MTLLFRMPPELKPRCKWFKGTWPFPLALYASSCLKLTTQRWLASYRDPSASAGINVMHYCCWSGTFMGGKEGSYCGKPSNKQIAPGITISSMLRLKHSSWLGTFFFLKDVRRDQKAKKDYKKSNYYCYIYIQQSSFLPPMSSKLLSVQQVSEFY